MTNEERKIGENLMTAAVQATGALQEALDLADVIPGGSPDSALHDEVLEGLETAIDAAQQAAWPRKRGRILAKRCGCRLEPIDDMKVCDLCSEATGMNDSVGWIIVRCPQHNAAPKVLEALENITGSFGSLLDATSEVPMDVYSRHLSEAYIAIEDAKP